MLTQERLKQLVSYNPSTGVFSWIKPRQGVVLSRPCGRINTHGYREIGIDRVSYRANRLAFLYMTGSMPDCDIDHVNRIKDDNRWENLRMATRSQNAANSALKKSNTSGFKGVVWEPDRKKWRVQIRIAGKKKNLGRFDSFDDAVNVSKKALINEFGDFAYEANN